VTGEARYRSLAPDEFAALPAPERAKYQRERAAFDAEVARHVEHGRREGWIDVGTGGKVVRMAIPVVLAPRRR
jgi:hypothetical protein